MYAQRKGWPVAGVEVGSLRMALADWAVRIDTPEVRQVATLLTRGDALGTTLSGSLMDQADHFRTAKKQLATLHANRMPVFLTFPLLFCFAPAVLIVLMTPAFLQLSEFLNPQNADNPLANNETISTQRIADQINAERRRVRARINSLDVVDVSAAIVRTVAEIPLGSGGPQLADPRVGRPARTAGRTGPTGSIRRRVRPAHRRSVQGAAPGSMHEGARPP